MICHKCAKRKHHKCKNGAWQTGTWCDCQHRMYVPPGYAVYMKHTFGKVNLVPESETFK